MSAKGDQMREEDKRTTLVSSEREEEREGRVEPSESEDAHSNERQSAGERRSENASHDNNDGTEPPLAAGMDRKRRTESRAKWHAANGGTGHVDKTNLPISTPRRIRDKEHLCYVASQPCIICGRAPSHAHHLRFAQPRALGRKVSDEWTVPLCSTHHRSLHNVGEEERWWREKGIDPIPHAARLWWDTLHGGLRPKETMALVARARK
jgi:hypothetical protein